MRAFSLATAASVAVLASIATASAGPLTASAILQSFNAVILENGSTPSDIEGAAAIGGNFSGATVYNRPGESTPSKYGALTVFGGTSGNPINVNNGGNAYVGGAAGAKINFNGGGKYITAPGSMIADLFTPLTALSKTLSQLSATSRLPSPANNEVIKAVAGANGIAVFDITAADLQAIPSFSVNLGDASTVVFNVKGDSASFNANDQSGANGAERIIWNFYEATGTVALNTLIGGTVLATGATVTNGNQIDGALAAKAWKGSGELHNHPFVGTLPSAAAVPEPTTLALFGIALAGIATMRRRR